MLSLWRRLSPHVVYISWREVDSAYPCFVIVAAAQQILAELVEGEFLEQWLSQTLLSWWRESLLWGAESDSVPLAESREQRLSKPLLRWWRKSEVGAEPLRSQVTAC